MPFKTIKFRFDYCGRVETQIYLPYHFALNIHFHLHFATNFTH